MDLYGMTNNLDIYMRTTAKTKFPAIEKAMIISGGVFRGQIKTESAMYMNRYIDQDPDSAYLVIQCDVKKGDCSRDMAHEFFDDFFYNVLHMPSSYDVKSGMKPTPENPEFGTLPRSMAISREILPAMNDADFKKYYDEQMAKMQKEMAKAMGIEVPDDDAFADVYGMNKKDYVEKHGFDPEDGNTIDIDDMGAIVPATKSVAQASNNAIALPKPIFYAVDFHMPAVMALGHDANNTVAYDSSMGIANSSIKKLGHGKKGMYEAEPAMTAEEFFAPVMEADDGTIKKFFPKDVDEDDVLNESFSATQLRNWNRLING